MNLKNANLEDEYFEVGNLIISSQFKADGRGTVNLTWEVPPEMLGKIRGCLKLKSFLF